MHTLGPESTFNESMYFNLYDPANGLGAFFRLGNRPNEGTGEMTVCIYLPDGRVAFMFDRPAVTTNDAFDAGGMRFEVLEPFTNLHVAYSGKALVLTDPLQMSDPKAAFSSNPVVEARVDLAYEGLSPAFGGEPAEPHEAPGEEFARGHYEQLVSSSGTISLGSEAWGVSGFGLRDHSWGPRTWQAPWYYRWLTGNEGPSFGFMGSRIARRDGPGTRGGFVWEGADLVLCDDCRVETTWKGGDRYHAEVELELRSGARTWKAHGTVRSLVPLRNRRKAPSGEVLVTRISEGLTEWDLGGGRKAFGLAEYLDQIVDGAPAGLAE